MYNGSRERAQKRARLHDVFFHAPESWGLELCRTGPDLLIAKQESTSMQTCVTVCTCMHCISIAVPAPAALIQHCDHLMKRDSGTTTADTATVNERCSASLAVDHCNGSLSCCC
jgi:hypothetical protein